MLSGPNPQTNLLFVGNSSQKSALVGESHAMVPAISNAQARCTASYPRHCSVMNIQLLDEMLMKDSAGYQLALTWHACTAAFQKH